MAVVFSLILPLLIGMAALAIDVGRLLVVRAELQSATDACALAAVAQLGPGSDTASRVRRAEAHGLALSDPLAQSLSGTPRPSWSLNRFDFQSRQFDTSRLAVSFAATASGPWLDVGEAMSAGLPAPTHARCTATAGGVPLLLAGAIGVAGPIPVSATSVASLVPSQLNCAFPLAVCKGAGTSAASSPPFGLTAGEWLREPTSSGSRRFSSGNFGWVDFSPPAGGADELSGQIAGQGSCSLQTGARVGESGVKSSAYDAWNGRFGLYRSGGPAPDASPGDFSGFAYTDQSWPAKRQAYSGSSGGALNFIASRAAFSAYQGNASSGVNVSYSSNWSSTQRRAQGRNRRLVATPIVDCSVWNNSGSAQPIIEGWACSLLLSPIATTGKGGPGQVEYLGLASAPGSPCASTGLPGSSLSAGPQVPVLVE